MTLYLDGAHTPQSIASGLEWFLEQLNATESPDDAASDTVALVFACSHERNPVELLELLCRPGVFQLAVFARPDSEKPSAEGKPTAEALLAQNGVAYRPELRALGDHGAAPPSWQDSLATAWRHLVTIRERDPGGEGTTSPGPRLAAGSTRHPNCEVVSSVSVPQALQALRERGDSTSRERGDSTSAARHVRVLVTGSLYLVGSVLSAVGWKEEDATGFLEARGVDC
jgi:folylpolyglutamate synthase/dihydropteroate synthase